MGVGVQPQPRWLLWECELRVAIWYFKKTGTSGSVDAVT